MFNKVFTNKFCLNFKKPEIYEEYQKNRKKILLYYNKLFGFILFMGSIATSAINYSFRESSDSLSFSIVKYSSYTNTFVNFLTFILCLFCKNSKVLRFVHYINYIFFIFTTANFKFPLITYVYHKTSVLMIALILVEILFRLSWVVISLFNFMEFFFLNFIEIILVFSYLYPTTEPETRNLTFFNLMCYALLFMVISVYAYILDKQVKLSFYLQSIFKDKVDFLNKVFDNINTGILTVRDNKITEMNTFLQKFFYKFLKLREGNETDGRYFLTFSDNIFNRRRL